MPKLNRVCNYCGTKYYVCKGCIDINSWKNSCCCPEHYIKLIESMNNKPIEIDEGIVKGMYGVNYHDPKGIAVFLLYSYKK